MAGQTIGFRPQIVNLSLYSGDGFNATFACKNSAGASIDVSGEVIAQIRKDRLHPEIPALATFAVSLVDAYLGLITLSLTGAQTDALLPDGETKFEGVWDVQWRPPDKEPRTLIQGTVECVADVTR